MKWTGNSVSKIFCKEEKKSDWKKKLIYFDTVRTGKITKFYVTFCKKGQPQKLVFCGSSLEAKSCVSE